MKVRAVILFATIILLERGSLHADPVAITGVVVNRPNKTRLTSVKVELVVDKKKGGKLTDDATHQGLYNLSCSGVGETVTSLWVICVDDKYTARPVAVRLDALRDGVRRGKAPDMEAELLEDKVVGKEALPWRLLAIEETEAVKVKLNLASFEEAKSKAEKRLRLTLSAKPLIGDQKAAWTVYKAMGERRNEELPKLFADEGYLLKFSSKLGHPK